MHKFRLRDNGRPQTVELTWGLARQWAEMTPVNGDRDLLDSRLLYYEACLNNGTFRPVCYWDRVYCLEEGRSYRMGECDAVGHRVNGKHTSTVLSQMPRSEFAKLPKMWLVYCDYEVDTLQDAAALYGTYDNPHSTRSRSDMNKTYASSDNDTSGYHSRFVNQVVAGLGFERWGRELFKQTDHDRCSILVECKEFVSWFHSFLYADYRLPNIGDFRKYIVRQGVVAAIYLTYKYDPVLCHKFWTHVIEDDELGKDGRPDSGLQTRRLHAYLASITMYGRSTSKRRSVTVADLYAVAVQHFNHWLVGSTRRVSYSTTGKVEIKAVRRDNAERHHVVSHG